MERVDYVDTFIAIAPDCQVTQRSPLVKPGGNPSVAAHPYQLTSGDVIFAVFADRHGISRKPVRSRPV